jgi:hypothetical protein
LIALIRAGQPQVRDQILVDIQNTTSVADLAVRVQDLVGSDAVVARTFEYIFQEFHRPESELSMLRSSRSGTSAGSPFTVVRNPINVRSRPWATMVDDEMGSHLLSLFFTWQQPWRQYIDKTSFLAGMVSQRDTNDNVFCSPLLVHAIFAYACVRLRLSFGSNLS